MNNNWPFSGESNKTQRSPIRTPISRRQPSLYREDRTRSQTKQIQHNKIEQNTRVAQNIEETQKIIMDQYKIQKNITNIIPEFSGDNRRNELARFLEMSDLLYETLTPEEKVIFGRLIKFRLTGEAYTRINNRNITEYQALKTLLNNMYQTTVSLDELEREMKETRQKYGESIRNFGYRLGETVEKYKNGYKEKYNLDEIDEGYDHHININSILTFKKGLINIKVKEKMVTSETDELSKIIDETEIVEHLLTATTNPTSNNRNNYQNRTEQTNLPTCSYCKKFGHSWNYCRSRINTENRNTQHKPFQYRPQNNDQHQPQFTNYKQPTNETRNPNNYRPMYQNHNATNQQQPNFTTFKPIPYQNINPKYCSHCKVTRGHTTEECRSKFLGQQNHNQQPQRTTGLEEQFNKMRINMTYPQQQENENITHQDQGNDPGSSHQ